MQWVLKCISEKMSMFEQRFKHWKLTKLWSLKLLKCQRMGKYQCLPKKKKEYLKRAKEEQSIVECCLQHYLVVKGGWYCCSSQEDSKRHAMQGRDCVIMISDTILPCCFFVLFIYLLQKNISPHIPAQVYTHSCHVYIQAVFWIRWAVLIPCQTVEL